MYVGRDLTELSLLQKKDWKDSELQYFHHSLQQMVPYLNVQGQSILKQILKEIESRGGLHRNEADYTHGTELSID
ncbi:hypothetical protein [Bacillus massiliigorillae]|uniref:hypothetical protein n=1 Tax=Bacillus massiliigorillae TaxID=1243664 RepID=UPI0003A922CC|nr:hypothetical protein [Bacillus massiliigorillae]